MTGFERHRDHYYEARFHTLRGPVARKLADGRLYVVLSSRGRPLLAAVVYGLVRLFGHPIWPLPCRWDYSKPYKGGY